MADILVNTAKGTKMSAEDTLKFLAGTEHKTPVAIATPAVCAALGTILGSVAAALTASTSTAAAPVTVTFDADAVQALKALWPAVSAYASTQGISGV